MAKIKGTVRDEDGSGLSGVKVRAHRLDDGAVLGEAVSSPAPAGDALEEFVALRINFNGGAQDTSSNGIPLTMAGGAAIVPGAAPGWGDELDCAVVGDSPRLTTPASTTLKLGGAFCLECWVVITTFGSDGSSIIRSCAPSDPWDASVAVFTSHNGWFQVDVLGVSLITPAGSVVLDERVHLAITMDEAGVVRVFLNGALAAGGNPETDTATAAPVDAPVWYFGSHPTFSSSGMGGWCRLDDIVLTVGDARYDPAGFAPPEEESTPGVSGGGGGAYEITTDFTGEVYVVGIAPADPARNHSIIRVVPG